MPTAIRREIGQLLIGSLAGSTIPPEIRSIAREFSLGGVTLFSRNIEAPEQVAELSIDLQTLASDLPLWVDERVMARPTVVLGGGSRSLKVRVDPAVFRHLPATEVVADLAV